MDSFSIAFGDFKGFEIHHDKIITPQGDVFTKPELELLRWKSGIYDRGMRNQLNKLYKA